MRIALRNMMKPKDKDGDLPIYFAFLPSVCYVKGKEIAYVGFAFLNLILTLEWNPKGIEK